MGEAFTWKGRSDSPRPERVHQSIKPFVPHEKIADSLTLLGFASAAGIIRNAGRPGADEGPRALRQQLANLCLPEGFFRPLRDAGDVSCPGDELEAAQVSLAQRVQQIRAGGSLPLVLGGGHETAWGVFQGIAPEIGPKKLGILNFDAHFDLRPLPVDGRGNSGTPFTQIAQWCAQNALPFDYTCIGIQAHSTSQSLWETARQHKVTVVTAEELHLDGLTTSRSAIGNMLDRSEAIYLSLCLDVFAAAFAPGVSAPQALGLFPWQVIPLLRTVLESAKVIAMDIVELSPPRDEGDKTAKLAASMVMEMMSVSGR
jgi:formiminoglutamase